MSEIEKALASFALTPALDTERSALQQRLTSKFLFPAEDLPQLAGELSAGYTVLPAGDKRSASYRTLHFDTADLAFFHAHRCGRRRREKVRIRHYDDRKLSFFEVKQRLPRAFGDDSLHAEDFALVRQYVRARGQLFPQVWTLFQRLTLVSLQDDERVTFDFNLRFSDGYREVGVLHVAIAEVKQPHLSRSTPVMTALHRRGIRRGRFSKYCAAIVALHPNVRHNRLRPQLRAMEAIEHE